LIQRASSFFLIFWRMNGLNAIYLNRETLKARSKVDARIVRRCPSSNSRDRDDENDAGALSNRAEAAIEERMNSHRRRYRPRVLELEGRALPSTFTVTSTADVGPGSLRQAILDNNATAGLNTIAFDIGGGGLQTIRPASALPTITNPVILDGTIQPGYAGTPLIELTGDAAGPRVNGLTISAGDSTVRGLVIHDFGTGIDLKTCGGDIIVGNFIGTDPGGTLALGNDSGILVEPTRQSNRIGGLGPADGNLISGNLRAGIHVTPAPGTMIEGNLIGTDVTGTLPLGNGAGILDESAGTRIGDNSAGAGNVISQAFRTRINRVPE
jgi:hypothetical protein